MTEFLQDVVSGLGFGAIYALAALGLHDPYLIREDD